MVPNLPFFASFVSSDGSQFSLLESGSRLSYFYIVELGVFVIVYNKYMLVRYLMNSGYEVYYAQQTAE
jgi:hypothetical protein